MTDLNKAIALVKNQLNFLIPWDYKVKERYSYVSHINYHEHYVMKYTGHGKQLEIAIATGNDNISMLIRRKLADEFAAYNDKDNFLIVDDLKFLNESELINIDSFSGVLKSRESLIFEYADLLKAYQNILCADDKWVDVKAIEANKLKKYAIILNKDLSTFNYPESAASIFTRKTAFLLNNGYHVIENSELLPPYLYFGWHILYGDGESVIRIQEDIRDGYYGMYINKKEALNVPIKNYKTVEKMADHFVYVLKEML